jgi:SAM-dependent methyltransferase
MPATAQIYRDGTYAAKNPLFGDDNAGYKIANAIKACRKFQLPHRSVAEVGCGAGAIILGFSQQEGVASAIGYEPMPEAFAVAKTRETAKLRFTSETIGPDSRADHDLVLCFDVFEHVEDCFGFLRHLRAMGKNHLFHIPLDMNAQMVARGTPIRKVRDEVGHLHYFCKDSALATLVECGYDIEGYFYTCAAEGNYQGGLMNKLMKYPASFCLPCIRIMPSDCWADTP